MKIVNVLKKKLFKSEEGITLIALVITIIVLLILAGVTVATITGENGLLSKAQLAKERNVESEQDEKDKLTSYEEELNNYVRAGGETVVYSEPKIFIDTSNVVKAQTTASDGEEYTATENCAVFIYIRENSGSRGIYIKVDGCVLYHIHDTEYYQRSALIYLKKGQKMTMEKDSNWPDNFVKYTVYGLF